MAVTPRYQLRSSLQKAWGRACRRVMVVIFSMPSTRQGRARAAKDEDQSRRRMAAGRNAGRR